MAHQKSFLTNCEQVGGATATAAAAAAAAALMAHPCKPFVMSNILAIPHT
jgi:hypothetical protein